MTGGHARLLLVVVLMGCAVERDRGGEPAHGVHGPGVLDPGAADFHGAVLRELAWDFPACQRCHGEDFGGGITGVSCLGCHVDGPTSCTTCHEPSSGAHLAHLVDAAVPCAECHVVPARWDAEGHLRRGGRRDDPPAEVVLGALAARDLTPPRRTAPPRYDVATQTCSGVYCHGGTLADPSARTPAPGWSQTGVATCGDCHGAPPAGHAATDRCDTCHRDAVHLDAMIGVGTTCTSCHGDADSPAPPRGLGGEISTRTLAVGAHRAHLTSSTLRGPIACTTCHVVPASVGAAGHIDSARPAEVVAAIGWDRASETCGPTCHGDARPGWTDSSGEAAACGTCHGLPPVGGSHTAAMTLASCTTCHPSVDGDGAIVFTGATSAHLDGQVDVR